LAEAMLTTRLDSLDLFWHEITSCHGELLAQAQLHYLTVAERRARIIKNNRPNKLADMLKVLSPTLAELVEELNRTWSSIRSILSPNRSFDEFELHTLSESFELIFKPQLRNASRTVQARTLLHVILGQEDPGTIFHGKMKQLFYQITPSLAPRWHEFLSLSLHLNTFNEFNDFDVARDLSPGDERGEPATAPITIDTALIDTNTAREILFSDLLEHDLHEVFTAFDSGESHWSLTSILGDTHACALRSHYLAELAPELSHGFWQSYADELAEMDERVRAAPAITPVGNQIARTLSFDTVENRYQRVFRQFIKSQATLAESPAKAEQASRRELVHDKPGSIRKNLQLTYCLFLLQRPAEPTPHEMIYGRHAFTSLLQLAPPLLTQLGTALQTSEAVDRLCQILENIDLTRLFEILVPGLAAHVHGLCEAIQNTAQETAQKTAQDTAQDTPAIKLYDKPGVLRAASWRALYRAEFSSPRPPTLRRFSLRLLEELSREFGSDLNKNSAQDASIVDAEASLQRIAIGQLQKNQEKKRQQMLSNQPEIKSTMSITASDKKPKQVNVETATGFAGDSNIFNCAKTASSSMIWQPGVGCIYYSTS